MIKSSVCIWLFLCALLRMYSGIIWGLGVNKDSLLDFKVKNKKYEDTRGSKNVKLLVGIHFNFSFLFLGAHSQSVDVTTVQWLNDNTLLTTGRQDCSVREWKITH